MRASILQRSSPVDFVERCRLGRCLRLGAHLDRILVDANLRIERLKRLLIKFAMPLLELREFRQDPRRFDNVLQPLRRLNLIDINFNALKPTGEEDMEELQQINFHLMRCDNELDGGSIHWLHGALFIRVP
jgi:hypothetical protein